ncbi:MAG TPA: hypothetical protein VFZ85_20080 [Jiangellaceae bacterium]
MRVTIGDDTYSGLELYVRRFVLIAILAGLLAGLVTAPASARTNGWEPAPSAGWELPAGVRCEFPFSGEPIVDEVRRKVLSTYPDGSVQREAYIGDLVLRITNLETGASTDADASGKAVLEYGEDGSVTWHWIGPVMVGFGDNSNHEKGLFILDGRYTMVIHPDGYREVVYSSGTERDLCAAVS